MHADIIAQLSLEYAIRKVDENQVELKLKGTHQLLACADVNLLGVNIDTIKKKNKLSGLSPRANYTDRANAACRWRYCQRLLTEGATWSAWRIPTAVISVFLTGAATFSFK
jgi:hypothetical protein